MKTRNEERKREEGRKGGRNAARSEIEKGRDGKGGEDRWFAYARNRARTYVYARVEC